jgi:hypothetical protein
MEHPARIAGRTLRIQAFAARASGFRPNGQKYDKRKIALIRTPCYKASRQTNIGHNGEKLPPSRRGCSLKLTLLEVYR